MRDARKIAIEGKEIEESEEDKREGKRGINTYRETKRKNEVRKEYL